MSSSDNTTKEWREENAPERRRHDGMIRRMPVRLTGSVKWSLDGHRLIDGSRERRDAEVFGGIGFHSRPAAGANAEAIVLFVGDGAENPVIVATRDEAARAAIAQLEADSTAIFNTKAIVLIKSDGTIEIRSAGGTAARLPTMADYEALRTAFNAHVHLETGASTNAPTAVPGVVPVDAPDGTQVLMTE